MAARLAPLVLASFFVLSCQTGGDGAEPADALAATGGPTALGPVRDEDVRDVVHRAIARAHPSVALGEADSFELAVIKREAGGLELDDDAKEAPDAIEVEARGWYKTRGEPAECASFDVTVRLTRVGAQWQAPEGQALPFTRQDAEDCY